MIYINIELKKNGRKNLSDEIQTIVTCQSRRLSTKFLLKNKANFPKAIWFP